MRRVKTVKDEKELEKEIDEYIMRGYKIQEQMPRQAKLHHPEFGNPWIHLLIFLTTIWFTLGLANIIYMGYKYATRDKIFLKVRRE